jgi:hypothetical protein
VPTSNLRLKLLRKRSSLFRVSVAISSRNATAKVSFYLFLLALIVVGYTSNFGLQVKNGILKFE